MRLIGQKKINGKSPTANRMAKFALNLIDDGLIGQQIFAGEATRLAYMTDEAQEGRDAFQRNATLIGVLTLIISSVPLTFIKCNVKVFK